MHLYSLTILRAVAVTMVVFGHCFALGNLAIDTVTERFFANLVAGATIIFVFVSGFLFHHVFMRKFEFGKFYLKKCQNVFAPYLALCFLSLTLGIGRIWESGPFMDGPIIQTGFLLGTGYLMTAYWFIPFIMLTFALSPLHTRFARLSMRSQLMWFLGLLAISVIIHRPHLNVSPFHSLVYFAPVYLFGIICSQRKEQIYSLLENRSLYLLGPILFLAGLQAVVGPAGNYHRTSLGFEGIDLMLLQKLVMCVFLMTFLHRFENWKSPVVDTLAGTSFAIFFLHPFAMHYVRALQSGVLVEWLPAGESVVMYVISASLVVGVCVVVALAVKSALGQRSRMLIGY